MGPVCKFFREQVEPVQYFTQGQKWALSNFTGVCLAIGDPRAGSNPVDPANPMYSMECLRPAFAGMCMASCASWGHTAPDWLGAAPYLFRYSPTDPLRTPFEFFAPEDSGMIREIPSGSMPDFSSTPVATDEVKRLLTCDPGNTMRIFQWQQNSGKSGRTPGIGPSISQALNATSPQHIKTVPALGPQCQSDSKWMIGQGNPMGCFTMNTEALPLPIDAQITLVVDSFQDSMKSLFKSAVEKSETLISAGVRVSAAGKSAVGLLPITFALLPGLAKGTKKVKSIVPTNPWAAFILVVVPPMQLPMLACVLCVLIQIGGSPWIWGGILCFLIVIQMPVLAAVSGTGPHENGLVFKASNQWWIKTKDKATAQPTYKVRKLLPYTLLFGVGGLALVITGILKEMGMGLDDVGMGDIFDDLNVAVPLFTVFKALLNFFKGKTFTVVMSADLLVKLMFSMQRNDFLFEHMREQYNQRVAAGVLMDMTPDEAQQARATYDTDGGGVLDFDEIEGMIKTKHAAHWNRSQKLTAEVNLKLREQRAKREKKAAEKQGAKDLDGRNSGVIPQGDLVMRMERGLELEDV